MAAEADETTLRYVRAADGAVLRHEVAGEGEPVVLLHGGFAGRDTFVRQRQPLAARYRLVLRDLRGHNGTESRIPANYGFDTTEADDLLAVLDAEGIERAHIVGHSSGAVAAFAFARRYPERVRRLVLLEPSFFSLLPPDIHEQEWAFYSGLIARAERGEAVAATHDVVTHVAGAGWEARARPSVIAQVDASAPMLAAHLQALFALRVTPGDVLDLKAPALYVHGRRSLPFYAAIFERIGAIRPDAHRLAIDDAGHAVHLQRPEPVNAAILEFLSSDEA
jgi:pimeloyl-ACP methyl ester carboxylesterase